jgi:protein-tyrosine phosphatase
VQSTGGKSTPEQLSHRAKRPIARCAHMAYSRNFFLLRLVIDMGNQISVLFVCMGNICRSPTAEGVFRHQVQAVGLGDRFVIDSAGTHAYHIGDAPDPRSIEAAARRGYDLSAQRARKVMARDFEEFDHVLAMDRDNLRRLAAACPPEHAHKLGLFMAHASKTSSDIVPDPYYGGGTDFDIVIDYVEDASAGLLVALTAR